MIRLQQSKHALGSEALLTLVGDDEHTLQEVFVALWQEIRLFEQTYSRFIAESELSVVNQRAGLPTPVSQEFIRLVTTAQGLSIKTGGLYNPFVLPALQSAGYKGSWPAPEKVDAELDYSSRDVVSVADLRLTPETVLLPERSALDFGGIGKGYLLDMLATVLSKAGVENYWLSLGGDILARGNDADGSPWEITIAVIEGQDPLRIGLRPDETLAVATSGTIKRRGPGWHHLIDPRTGKSADTDVLTATVCLSSATEADVFAKCLVLLGSDKASGFTKKHKISRWSLQIRDARGTLSVVKQGM